VGGNVGCKILTGYSDLLEEVVSEILPRSSGVEFIKGTGAPLQLCMARKRVRERAKALKSML
jgi:hypothetical protein